MKATICVLLVTVLACLAKETIKKNIAKRGVYGEGRGLEWNGLDLPGGYGLSLPGRRGLSGGIALSGEHAGLGGFGGVPNHLTRVPFPDPNPLIAYRNIPITVQDPFVASIHEPYPVLAPEPYSSTDQVVCCEEKSGVRCEKNKKEEIVLEVENKYLKELLTEVKDKNTVLHQNNELLIKNLKLLENQMDSWKMLIANRKREEIYIKGATINQLRALADWRKDRKPMKKTTVATQINVNDKSAGSVKNEMLEVSRKIFRQSTKKDGPTENINNSNQQQNLQKRGITSTNKQKLQKKNIGAGSKIRSESMQDFTSGTKRRVWLYLYRVERTATSDMINEYLMEKLGLDKNDVGVKEIPTEPTRKKCFMVIVPIGKIEEVFRPEFWPEGVGVKRFDLDKFRKFLNKQSGNFIV